MTPSLRAWVEYTCDQLSASFRAQQEAVPSIDLGIMVMYLGAEKAGIRLADYGECPVRVGELMFDDSSFSKIKGKTDELFSALFHRRFIRPENAYSESTAYPADRLSASNMAAKLAVSTISDVRNTMYMSGLTPFPLSHWDTLAPAMRKQAAIHDKLAGHAPKGPFKHYWGEWSRYAGDDRPYGLFLASGVPFEVTDAVSDSGWTFLSDADAIAVASGLLPSPGTQYVVRPETGKMVPGARRLSESPEALWKLKHEILEGLRDVPHVVNEAPVVCAWYPTAKSVLLWNLAAEKREIALQMREERRIVPVDGLDVALVEEVV